MNKILLSIIVPVYNVENYIGCCIDSLYHQDVCLQEYEVVCINDGSTDSSLLHLKKYQEKYNNFRIINKANGGMSSARNAGIENSRGQYLMFVDSDDYVAYNILGLLFSKLRTSNYDMLYYDLMTVTDESEIKARYADDSEILVYNGKDYYKKYFPNNSACCFLINKTFINKEKLYFIEGKCCEDGMFTMNAINKCNRIGYVHLDVYRYVKRPNSITTRKDRVQLLKMIDDFMYAIEYFSNIIKKEMLIESIDIDYINKLILRRNSYVFFLQVRILRAHIDIEIAKQILLKLNNMEAYPNIGIGKYYPGFKMRFLEYILNDTYLFMFLVRCNNVLKIIS